MAQLDGMAWRLSGPDLLHDGNAPRKEGRGLPDQDSQEFHRKMQCLVRSFLTSAGGSLRVGGLGALLVDALEILEEPIKESTSCKPRSMAGTRDLFPLPVPAIHTAAETVDEFLRALIGGLNSLHSPGEVGPSTMTSVAQGVMKRLRDLVERSRILDEVLPPISFDQFFTEKGLDYAGDEVRRALPISWKSIEASLPPEVGCLDIRDFCTGGVLHFIDNIDDMLIPWDDQKLGRAPSVMIQEGEWETVAHGLVSRGLCEVVPETSLYRKDNTVLLNGLFSVGKDEVKDGIPVTRLIMNLKPWNAISRPLAGDVGTLPAITQMTSIHIHDDDVLVTSSEDLRCFFYLFAVPQAWKKFMGFGRQVPASLIPEGGGDVRWYLTARVLPMGYLNSVGIAQHIHRAVVLKALGSVEGLGRSVQEIRRDRSFTAFPNLFRVYLDNFDQLQMVDRRTAGLIEGSTSELVGVLREQYAESMLPRHPKKSVQQACAAEVQGAWLDGDVGTMSAKPSKVAKYIMLALELLGRGKASQRELQVVGGGFVYVAMFRRPLLSSLNQIWRSIVESNNHSPLQRFWLKREVMVELVRFICLCPLGFMVFRSHFDPMVTASDASTSGGGICHSTGLTPFGLAASSAAIRGDLPEEQELTQVLSIGLFDGIAALRVALDILKTPMAGHISIEKDPQAQRVVEANFADSERISDVELVDDEMVKQWSLKYSAVGLVIVGAGPPCQGVSGLNCDRKGALRDHRSKLFTHVPRITQLIRHHFPWAQVHGITESVASMDASDCQVMSDEFGISPWYIDAAGICLAHRPRLFWLTWEVQAGEGVEILLGSDGRLPIQGQINLKADFDEKLFLEKGWKRYSNKAFPTFTTSRPSALPLRRPAGLRDCSEEERARYKASLTDFFSYLRREGLELPSKRDSMDGIVADYLEYLWAEGEGRATASTFLAALQDYEPKLKHNLPASWRLMKTWTTHEVRQRRRRGQRRRSLITAGSTSCGACDAVHETFH
eukprot:s1760_g12.t1